MMNIDEQIEEIVKSDITDNTVVANLLVLAREEENDVLRAVIRSFIQDKSFKIIDRLLDSVSHP
jgi:hypothetical protein